MIVEVDVEVDILFDFTIFVALSIISICVLLSFEVIVSSWIDFFNFDLNTCNRLFLFLLNFDDDDDDDIDADDNGCDDSNIGGIEGIEAEDDAVNDDDDERKTFKYG